MEVEGVGGNCEQQATGNGWVAAEQAVRLVAVEHVTAQAARRRSERLAVRRRHETDSVDSDTARAHKVGKHESVSMDVECDIEPWRDKSTT